MKFQYKFGLGIIVIFCILSFGIANMCVQWANTCTIREAENRVEVYIKAAWSILDCKISRIRSVLEILTQEQEIIDLLRNPDNPLLLITVRENLEVVRKEQDMDILSADPMIKKVILTGHRIAT